MSVLVPVGSFTLLLPDSGHCEVVSDPFSTVTPFFFFYVHKLGSSSERGVLFTSGLLFTVYCSNRTSSPQTKSRKFSQSTPKVFYYQL